MLCNAPLPRRNQEIDDTVYIHIYISVDCVRRYTNATKYFSADIDKIDIVSRILKITSRKHTYDIILTPLKAPKSLKIDLFFIQERVNKLIYGINTIIKCRT